MDCEKRRSILLALLLGVAAGCTTVVQEPADLDGTKVESLRVVEQDADTVHVVSPQSWAEPGRTYFITNRLTGFRTSQVADGSGVLDVTVAGRIDDVYAVSQVEDAPHPAQLMVREGETIHAWGWGWSGLEGCARGEFLVGEAFRPDVVHDDHEACIAFSVPTTFGEGGDTVPAVGSDTLRQELLERAPALRYRLRAEIEGDLTVLVVGTDATGHDRTWFRQEHFLPEEVRTWSTRRRIAEELLTADGEHLRPATVVRGLFFRPEGPHAADFQFQVDDVVLESATFVETDQ